MAHIREMKDKARTVPWRAHVNRKGHKPLVKMFKTKQEAEQWAGEQERSIRLVGLPLTIDQLKKHTVGEIVKRYLAEITPKKASSVNEAAVLKKFLRENSLAKKSLAYVSSQDAHAYRRARENDSWRDKPIAAPTIRREVSTFAHIFETAILSYYTMRFHSVIYYIKYLRNGLCILRY
jgi:hypothetical protein